MPTKDELRETLRQKLTETLGRVNEALAGANLAPLEPVLKRVAKGRLPHWYKGLKSKHALPNLDGKTVGSVVEMILVAVLETWTFAGLQAPELRLSPAKGVDLPDLDLGIKSPSENYCTSEPFFSAYERLLGSDHDALVLLTDYQKAKKKPPLKLKIIDHRYLKKSQVADKTLCRIALRHRDWLLHQDESRAKRVIRFLAYVNQGDWRARRLLRLVDHLQEEDQIRDSIREAESEFKKANREKEKRDKLPIPAEELQALLSILTVSPLSVGVIDATENWVMETRMDGARAPNDEEWRRFLASPLDGKIGMSPALQWRYNFGPLFGVDEDIDEK